jgi:hypothetical protein
MDEAFTKAKDILASLGLDIGLQEDTTEYEMRYDDLL